MKSLLFTLIFALASLAIASATDSKPECDYWASRSDTLEELIDDTKEKLKECQSACPDTETLLDSYEREYAVNQEFLNDPFYWCGKRF